MLQTISQNVLKRNSFKPLINQRRTFWEYVNMMFNKPDPDRIKHVGPDRACAEWVLRNGGKIIWADGKLIRDYNLLPPDNKPVKPKILILDGSDSSISHYGFPHLAGCTMLYKVILHNSSYIDDRALKGLYYGRDTLTHVQISRCCDVSDNGLKELRALRKLRTLVLFDLASVGNINECVEYLQQQLPDCEIKGAEEPIGEQH